MKGTTKAGDGAGVAVGYVRVSTEGQVAEGVSLDAQQARIRSWCDANDYTLVGIQIDAGLSGKRADNRPGLQGALTDACRCKGALVVYSLSRLARSTADALAISERLDRSGADLVSLSERIDTTTAAGKMVFRMLAVLAEFERDLISERTTLAMACLRRQHRRISGNIPYGMALAADGSSLLELPHENRVIEKMMRWKGEGMSLNGIARTLNERCLLSKNGGLWSAKVVRDVLRRATL